MGDCMINYLPECCCEGEEICQVHGPMVRGKTMRRASLAAKDGKVPRAAYEAWKKKYANRKPKIPFGSLN